MSKPTGVSLHIIKVAKGSAADRHGLLPMFHYITAVNDVEVVSEEDILKITQSWESGGLRLLIYDSRTKETQLVEMVRAEDERIGFSIKLHTGEMYPFSFRVLDIEYNSPAIEAGLHKDQDYIIGYEGGSFSNVYEFESILEKHKNTKLVLLVYNMGMISIRKVEIVPNSEGEIGCDLGSGILNDVPFQPGKVEIVEDASGYAQYLSNKEVSEPEREEDPLPTEDATGAPSITEEMNHAVVNTESSILENPEHPAEQTRPDEMVAEQTNLAQRLERMSINTKYPQEASEEEDITHKSEISRKITEELTEELQAEINAQEIEQALDESLYETLNTANTTFEYSPAPNTSSNQPVVHAEDEEVEDHIARISQSNQTSILTDNDQKEINPPEAVFDYEYEESKNIASSMLTNPTAQASNSFLMGFNQFPGSSRTNYEHQEAYQQVPQCTPYYATQQPTNCRYTGNSQVEYEQPGPLASYIPCDQAYNMLNMSNESSLNQKSSQINPSALQKEKSQKEKTFSNDPFYIQPGDEPRATNDIYGMYPNSQ